VPFWTETDVTVPFDLMFVLATTAFAWGLSVMTYRWFAIHNGWPMGAWQSGLPTLPQAIGLAVVAVAVVFALARGMGTALVLPLLGIVCAFGWTALLKVGAQSALLLGPLAAVLVLVGWAVSGV
jgi:hypothetical protein